MCWDTFDSDEIWSQVARERRTSERGPPPPKDEPRRGSRLSDDEPRAPRERRGTGFSTGGGGAIRMHLLKKWKMSTVFH